VSAHWEGASSRSAPRRTAPSPGARCSSDSRPGCGDCRDLHLPAGFREGMDRVNAPLFRSASLATAFVVMAGAIGSAVLAAEPARSRARAGRAAPRSTPRSARTVTRPASGPCCAAVTSLESISRSSSAMGAERCPPSAPRRSMTRPSLGSASTSRSHDTVRRKIDRRDLMKGLTGVESFLTTTAGSARPLDRSLFHGRTGDRVRRGSGGRLGSRTRHGSRRSRGAHLHTARRGEGRARSVAPLRFLRGRRSSTRERRSMASAYIALPKGVSEESFGAALAEFAAPSDRRRCSSARSSSLPTSRP
jgi:hypothetical protein